MVAKLIPEAKTIVGKTGTMNCDEFKRIITYIMTAMIFISKIKSQ